MSKQNEDFMFRWYNEVWNNSNENAIDELFHPVGKAHGLGADPLIGPGAFKEFYRAFKHIYADVKVTVDKNLIDGPFLVALCTVKAIYKATGKPVTFTGISVAEVENGQLVNAWNYFDFLNLYVQIGKINPEQLID